MTRADPISLGLERRVAGFVTRYGVLRPADDVLLLLSGGADSMALLAMLPVRRAAPGPRPAARRGARRLPHAAERPPTATAASCERACAAADVPLDVLRLPERPRGPHFQARARDIRYE